LKPSRFRTGFKPISQLAFEAVTGRLGVLAMAFSYTLFALVLLGYVSKQVYTSSLMEDVSHRRAQELVLKEEIGMLTSQYASLVSRQRVADYCEGKLGMVEADDRLMTRVAIGDVRLRDHEPLDLVEPAVSISDVLGSNIGDLTEAIRR